MNWLKDKFELKWITIIVFIGVLFFFKNALNFLLLTFIITYLAYTVFTKLIDKLPRSLQKPKLLLLIMYSLILLIIINTSQRNFDVQVSPIE